MNKAVEQGRDRQGRISAAGLLLALCAFAFSPTAAGAAAPQVSGLGVSSVTGTTVTLQAKVNPQGKLTAYHFEYGTVDCEPGPCTSVPVPDAKLAAGSSPVPVSVAIEGLVPATLYHFRLVAKNSEGEAVAKGIFATRSPAFSGLPDSRAYEQASPVDKNGGDAVGEQALVKAAADGSAITFGSTFGIPGNVVGAQGLPLYLASRSSSWSMQGLFPPAKLGERAAVTGWLPDFSETFTSATKLGNPRSKALFSLSTTGKAPIEISPYVAKADYFFAGTSKDAATVVFESQSKLPEGEAKTPSPAAIADASNVYAWDRATGQLRLASVLNDGKSPPKGAFAGPYDWSKGTTPSSLREGGSARTYYLQEERAVGATGDVYFTAATTGQLYLRRNPTKAQSPLDAGKCTKPELACTVHVSATHKTNGQGEGGADPAGPQPAAFQAASADGSEAFFTSSEKLTNDANTGPEQPAPAIGIGSLAGAIEDASFIPTRAVGVAVDSKFAYWADPSAGTIGRAELANPASADPAFIAPGPIECEIEKEPGSFESVPAKPRYVAVDAGHIYWTNTGCLKEEDERPRDGGGTIGRADIDGTPASVEPACIEGASNPQGIAVNATHIYWANSGRSNPTATIARATLECDEVEQVFFEPNFSKVPHGVALSAAHVYFTINTNEEEEGGNAFVYRVPLGGGEDDFTFISNTAKLRGIATDATHVYWAAQGEEAIGRIPIADFPEFGPCENVPSCEKAFVKVKGELNGLAADAAHLYWSVNGEAPGNPGNDLYRFERDESGGAGTLTDLTVEPSGNGAEVQGVIGASADGSRAYFVANAVLDEDEEATPGSCKGATISTKSGTCNLYLWEEGEGTSFVARLRAGDGGALNWTGASEDLFGSNSYTPKTAFLTPDGATLLLSSQESLTAYDSEGTFQLYRYRAGDAEPLLCVSCPPTGEAAVGASLGRVGFPGMSPLRGGTATVASRNLSADGDRAFFETRAALVPEDTNGQLGCPPTGAITQQYPACLDVYEWEAPGTGSCQASAPAYSPLNGGCLYLISSGKSDFPSLFADASASGDDVFFFTRQQLVKQDKDELQDVYDARVGGGLAAQNPPPPNICESTDACHGAGQEPPAQSTPGSATFVGPGNAVHKHKKQKAGKRKAKKQKKAKGKKQRKANAKRRAGR